MGIITMWELSETGDSLRHKLKMWKLNAGEARESYFKHFLLDQISAAKSNPALKKIILCYRVIGLIK